MQWGVQFRHGNPDSLTSLIPNSKNRFTVGNYNIIDIVSTAPSCKSFFRLVLVSDIEETSLTLGSGSWSGNEPLGGGKVWNTLE